MKKTSARTITDGVSIVNVNSLMICMFGLITKKYHNQYLFSIALRLIHLYPVSIVSYPNKSEFFIPIVTIIRSY